MTALIVVTCLYLAPTIIAWLRGHRNGVAIFALNLLLGWTFLGWVVALVWSFTDNARPKMRRGDKIYIDRQDEVLSPMRVLPEQFEGESDSAFAARVRSIRGQASLSRR